MKITDILASSKKTFPSLEIVPPMNGMTKTQLISSIEPFMEFSPKYINVTSHREEIEFRQEPDGSFSRHIVRNRVSETAVCAAIMEAFKGVEAVPHIICAGSSKDRIDNLLHDLNFLGISNVLALRGDAALGEKRFTPEPDGYSHANELVEGIRSFEDSHEGSGFCIGVGAYPEKHCEAANLETDIANLKRKVDTGADYIITQMFFDNEDFYRFEKMCREAGITVPIIPGLKPVSTERHIEFLPQSFSIDIPLELTSEIRKAAGDKDKIYEIGSEWCAAQCKDLIRHGIPAIHFYTMGKAKNIVGILRKCF